VERALLTLVLVGLCIALSATLLYGYVHGFWTKTVTTTVTKTRTLRAVRFIPNTVYPYNTTFLKYLRKARSFVIAVLRYPVLYDIGAIRMDPRMMMLINELAALHRRGVRVWVLVLSYSMTTIDCDNSWNAVLDLFAKYLCRDIGGKYVRYVPNPVTGPYSAPIGLTEQSEAMILIDNKTLIIMNLPYTEAYKQYPWIVNELKPSNDVIMNLSCFPRARAELLKKLIHDFVDGDTLPLCR